MQNSQLTILIPALARDLIPELKQQMPALTLLMKRAEATQAPVNYWEGLLCYLFGMNINEELPVAALTGLTDSLATQTGYWLRADPIQLQADLAAVYMLDNKAIQFSEQENNLFKQEINNFLKQDQLTLLMPAPNRWYIKLDQPIHVTTSPISQVIAQNITEFLPSGTNQAYWRKLMTELQMLLYTSHVNQNRTHKINSLWFWGAGQLPVSLKANWQLVMSQDPLLRGLAQTANISLQTPPNTAPMILKQLSSSQQTLISLEPNTTLSSAEWLLQMETTWFKPLVAALRKKQLNSLTLYLGTDKLFHANWKNIWYFWC